MTPLEIIRAIEAIGTALMSVTEEHARKVLNEKLIELVKQL